ncbi:hypothetical protein [Niallia sp. 01092]|uniref:hypothetical protein n=1 Tax=unclassified Niallia TaxID=2837522 RepID=UPI003FD50A1D
MYDYDVPTHVVLPERLWEEAKDAEHLKELILQYMQRYPQLKVKTVHNGMAVCKRK